MVDVVNVNEYITRSEYETRHSELRTEMLRLATNDDVIRKETQARFDLFAEKMDNSFKATNDKIDRLDDLVSKAGSNGWKTTALALINLGIGVAAGYAIHFLGH